MSAKLAVMLVGAAFDVGARGQLQFVYGSLHGGNYQRGGVGQGAVEVKYQVPDGFHIHLFVTLKLRKNSDMANFWAITYVFII